MEVPALRRRLLAWYDRHRRDLPWRGQDVYGVWVSEAMLQQTRVDVVIPYYERWMARFPTVRTLAAASEEEVLQAWAGLGYYSRARNLHAAAKTVARSGWPRSLEQWRALPGVGPYTAAAVASIAQGRPHACVDGNVVRVVARLSNEPGVVTQRATRARIEATAQGWLSVKRPGDWNQAMMDLGATVCQPRNPRCDTCPVAALCASRSAGTQARVPRKAKSKPPQEEYRRVAVVQKDGGVLFVRAQTGLLGGLWTLPAGAMDEDVAQHVLDQTGVQVHNPTHVRPPMPAKHQFSHRTWLMEVQRVDLPASHPSAASGSHESAWIPIAELHHHAIPAATKVALAAVGIPIPATTGTTASTTTRVSLPPRSPEALQRVPKRGPRAKAAKPKSKGGSARP